jgi:hypothetical protein
MALISKCAKPQALPSQSTAQDLAEWAIEWIGFAGCENSKRMALIEAWPR